MQSSANCVRVSTALVAAATPILERGSSRHLELQGAVVQVLSRGRGSTQAHEAEAQRAREQQEAKDLAAYRASLCIPVLSPPHTPRHP